MACVWLPGGISCLFYFAQTKKGIKSKSLKFLRSLLMAEKERFELSMDYNTHTRLAGERLQPLGHFSVTLLIGGGGRIRTHEALTLNGFQDRRLQPLGHSSESDPEFISSCFEQVKDKIALIRINSYFCPGKIKSSSTISPILKFSLLMYLKLTTKSMTYSNLPGDFILV